MKTAFIFPGLNALLKEEDRHRYLALPTVQRRFEQAQEALKKNLQIEVNFSELLRQPTEQIYAIDKVSLAAVAICAIQTGVYDYLSNQQIKAEWLMGCSLGDLARSVAAEAYDFETAVVNHVRFTHGIEGIDKIGGNIGVATSRERPFQEADYEWFDSVQVDVSRLTPRLLNIGGLFGDLEKVQEKAKEMRWRVMPILNYPAHSRYLLPFVDRVRDDFKEVQTTSPKTKMFSSFSCRPIHDPEEIKQEFLLSITKTIHWHEAIAKLALEEGITRFVNIGPDQSLTKMMADISLASNFDTVEAYQLMDASIGYNT